MFYRKFSLLFQDIILVGCGGTGSRVVAPLIQTIKQAQMQINPCLYVVDGDIFENKNLARQNCVERDMGRNKAVVMAERYGAALDFPVVAHPHMIKPGGYMFTEIGNSARDQGMRRPLTTRKLIIMCVDSINARLMIMAQAGPNDIIIDAGNEDTFGQVSIFDKISLPHVEGAGSVVADIKPFSGEYELPFIPAPVTQYLDALVNPPAATGSCAELDQSLAINNLMAAGIINKVQNLAYNNPFYSRTDYYDLIKGNSSERMTPVWLNQVCNEVTEYRNADTESYSNWSAAHFLNPTDSRVTSHNLKDRVIGRLTTSISESVKFIDPALLAALGK